MKLVICSLTSVILIVLSIVNLQFHGQFVPVSLRPVLRIVAAHVMATVWESCNSLLYLVRVFISIRQFTGNGAALEEELKVLDYA